MNKLSVLLVSALTTFVSAACSAPIEASAEALVSKKDPLDCGYAPRVLARILRSHYSFNEVDEVLTARVVKQYIERLDPSRSLFLKSEVAALEPRVRALVTSVRQGECSVVDGIFADVVERQKLMQRSVDALLADPKLALDESITLVVSPDERDWPATAAEREALRRKLVHFQLANMVVSGTTLEAAKKKLSHRYELTTKRLAKMDAEDRLSTFLDAFAGALDPHSTYFSAEALEDFSIGMKLSLEGIGAVLGNDDGYTIVNEVVLGGAAERQGQLKTKDKIIAVAQEPTGDSVDVIDEDLRDVVRLIRGKKGSQVRLTVLRQGEKSETLNIVITRDKIDLKEQAAKVSYHAVDAPAVPGKPPRKLNLALVDLPSFYGGRDSARQCTDDLKAILAEVNTKHVDGVVLDLSRNGGGLLQHAVEIGGYFLESGAIVGVGARGQSIEPLEDTDPDVQFAGPMVVLVSRQSASASEIVSGALKDYRRAVIVGDDHTFGKGTVQNVIDLEPGYGAVKVTTAMFFRPGGESTQNTGVASDVILPSPYALDEWGEASDPLALKPARTPGFASSTANARGVLPIVSSETMGALAVRSAERVAKSERFGKMKERAERARKNRGTVRLGDLMADKKDAKAEKGKEVQSLEDEEEDKAKKGEPTTHASEALAILADLVARP